MSGTPQRITLGLAALTVGGCTGIHSALDPAGPQASSISHLWWVYFAVSALVFVASLVYLIVAMWKRRWEPEQKGLAIPRNLVRERRAALVVMSLVGITTIILFGLLIGDFWTGQSLQAMSKAQTMTLKIIAHQWWWEVHYDDEIAGNIVITANELHLPIGRAVKIKLESRDVIHSFWVPNLHGKRDLIPGHPTETHLQADRRGTYWGQCSEFCGAQHANMRIVVVVESEEDFRRWLTDQRKPAAEPQTEPERRGREVFLGTTCVLCHRIRGTRAGSILGPDLTHVASRQRIAAGTLENLRGHLAGWIVDSQRVKPGVKMPLNPLPAANVNDLIEYLSHLE